MMYGWVEVHLAPQIFYLGTRWRRVVSFTSRLLYLWRKSPATHS